jgi:hypothetical protein
VQVAEVQEGVVRHPGAGVDDRDVVVPLQAGQELSDAPQAAAGYQPRRRNARAREWLAKYLVGDDPLAVVEMAEQLAELRREVEGLQVEGKVEGKVMLSGYPSDLYDGALSGWRGRAAGAEAHDPGQPHQDPGDPETGRLIPSRSTTGLGVVLDAQGDVGGAIRCYHKALVSRDLRHTHERRTRSVRAW